MHLRIDYDSWCTELIFFIFKLKKMLGLKFKYSWLYEKGAIREKSNKASK